MKQKNFMADMVSFGPSGMEHFDRDGNSLGAYNPKPRKPEKNRGGHPGLADWEAIEEAFFARVEELGLPDKLNEKGWRFQADVVRWVDKLLMEREKIEDMKDSTIKYHVRRWLTSARNGQKGQKPI